MDRTTTLIPIDPTPACFQLPQNGLQPWDKIRLDTTGATPGRIWGMVAPVGVALQDGLGGVWTIDELFNMDPNLDRVHQGTTTLDDGTKIETGNISGFGGHINPEADLPAAVAHYMGDTNSRLARVRYGWQHDSTGTLLGLVVSGIVWPDRFDPMTAAIVDAHPSSMDARWLVQRYDPFKDGRHVLAGACLVNQAGLPFVRGGIREHNDRLSAAIAASFTPAGITAEPKEQSSVEAAQTKLSTSHRTAWDKYQTEVVSARQARDAAIAAIDKKDPDRQVKAERLRADFQAAKQTARESRTKTVRTARARVTEARKQVAAVKKKQAADSKAQKKDGEKDSRKDDAGEKSKQITKAGRERRKQIYTAFAKQIAAAQRGQRSKLYAQRSQALADLRQQIKDERAALTAALTPNGPQMETEIEIGTEVQNEAGDIFEVVEVITVGDVVVLRLDDDSIVAADTVTPIVDEPEAPVAAAAGDVNGMPPLESMVDPASTASPEELAVLTDRVAALETAVDALNTKTAAVDLPIVDLVAVELASLDELAASLN